jgi:hypothetical protein
MPRCTNNAAPGDRTWKTEDNLFGWRTKQQAEERGWRSERSFVTGRTSMKRLAVVLVAMLPS